ncbi:growth hormone secretagogue receptor type 1-like [Littorina saxatilis]|uniref:growth hormone secretagogue receptor type 1-like n=1 Tax=Littorina saxatilis TaxID=31220 RepID=UPI0038B45A2D
MSTSPPSYKYVTLTSRNTSKEEEAVATLNWLMPWLLFLIGGVCNVLIIMGMRTRNFRSLSTSVFMTVVAFNDLISLLVLVCTHWIPLNFPTEALRNRGGDVLCKLFNFYGWGQADLGLTLISAMTADRAYVILRPMTSVDLVKRAKIVISVCVGVVVVKEFHFFFTSVMVAEGRLDRLCDVNYNVTGYYNFYVNYWPWIDTVFVTLCFVVMVISNTIIIRHVRKNRKGRQITIGEDNRGSSTSRLSRSESTMTVHGGDYEKVAQQVTRMLLAESLAFILLSYPFSLHLVVTSQTHDPRKETAEVQTNALAFSVVFYLLYANKCVDFLVYCLAGKRFRKAILTDVLCWIPRCKRLPLGKSKKHTEAERTDGTNSQCEHGEDELEMYNNARSHT